MRTSEITQEDKNTIINCYNSYYTAEHTLNIVPVNIMQYYSIINEAREKGLIRSEGKEYVMQDGDVVNFLFNV